MTDGAAQWPRSIREVPQDPDLIAEASVNPGGRVAEIDSDMVGGDPDGFVPAEAIRGYWLVGDDGTLTGEYTENPHHGTPTDDFTKLTELVEICTWLPDELAPAIRDYVEDELAGQVAGAQVEWMKVIATPEVVTGGRGEPYDKMLAGVAVPFALSVRSPDDSRDILWGVFTWATSSRDEPGGSRYGTWLEFGAGIDWAKERLPERIFEVDDDVEGDTAAEDADPDADPDAITES